QLDLAVPGHLGELVHRGNHEGRQQSIDVFVNDADRQAFAGRATGGEIAATERVAAVGEDAAARRVGLNVVPGTDALAAPGAVRQLVEGAGGADAAPEGVVLGIEESLRPVKGVRGA